MVKAVLGGKLEEDKKKVYSCSSSSSLAHNEVDLVAFFFFNSMWLSFQTHSEVILGEKYN